MTNMFKPEILPALFPDEALYDSNENSYTRASIETYYSQLNGKWETATQIAYKDGTPYSRTFSIPDFAKDTQDRLDIIDLGGFDPVYNGQYYYQLISLFNEEEWYSSSSSYHENFLKWERTYNTYQQVVTYSNEEIGRIEWSRPFTTSSFPNTITTSGGGPSVPGGILTPPVPTPNLMTCALSLPAINSTPTTTGASSGFSTSVDLNNTYCKRWSSISKPFTLNVYVGSAVGAQVLTDGSPLVYRKSNLSQTGTIVSGNILMVEPYLSIQFNNPSTVLPTYVTVVLYGKEVWRVYQPHQLDSEPEIIRHPVNVENSIRFKPPGKSYINDTFWNSTPNSQPFIDFHSRQGKEPSFV